VSVPDGRDLWKLGSRHCACWRRAFFEHSHRVIAGGLGVFTLSWRLDLGQDNRRWLRVWVIAVAGIAVQRC